MINGATSPLDMEPEGQILSIFKILVRQCQLPQCIQHFHGLEGFSEQVY